MRTMGPTRWRLAVCAALLAAASGGALPAAAAQESHAAAGPEETGAYGFNHADCEFFGPERERFLAAVFHLQPRNRYRVSALTEAVAARLPVQTAVQVAGPPAPSAPGAEPSNLIDRFLFDAMREAGVEPAPRADDFEFLRRLTLDLTGRVPPPDRLLRFVRDPDPGKRARVVEELLASPEWIDKWTMYFGDLFKNSRRAPAANRYPMGRNAFYQWIYESLQQNKPYNRMAAELIAATGENNWERGELNWLLGGLVTGGPRSGQDHYDQLAANTAQTFLGIAHMNCILCHDGRRRLDGLSLWGEKARRFEGWELASFFSKTIVRRTRVEINGRRLRYYSIIDRPQRRPYPLNTDSGNRPPRQPVGQVTNVEPRYPFSGGKPAPGESYREALAREVTGDFQFARAAVNYIWKEFFGLAFVEPPDQFDPARLDPDNPPPEPWTLQPNHPRLLNALAQEFIDGGYDLKRLMRTIVTSEAYQLSSRYPGEWKPEYEPLYARKYVRRLWAEEIHDAVAQTSGLFARYRIRGVGLRRWAMQFPEPYGIPGFRNPVTAFLDAFQRGDRYEEERRGDGSVIQALQLMNHPFVVERVRAVTYGRRSSLTARVLRMPDRQAVDALYLTILSRFPTPEEREAALDSLAAGPRTEKIEDLAWALYNSADFVFNH